MEVLKQEVAEKNFILFVGSGVSHSLGLPTWHKLIANIGSQLGFDPELFMKMDNYLALAEYYKIEKSDLGPLRSEIDREWNSSTIDIRKSEIHELIVRLRAPLIYTTNYDHWIEKAHDAFQRPYKKIVSVNHLIRARSDVTQIIKFHGDFENDSSMVLTETSYFDRLSLDSALDIKLRSDSLARPILFIGYSLSDINVRYLLYKLSNFWKNTPFEHKRPRSYIFLTKPNPVQEAVLSSRQIQPIVSASEDPKEGLIQFLKEILPESQRDN